MFFNKRSTFQSVSFNGVLSSRGKIIKKKKGSATLMLTSLIDAFSILVVYLLMFFSNAGEITYVSSDIDLPKASIIERLDRYSILQIKTEGYFVEDTQLKLEDLVSYLIALKTKLNKNVSLAEDQKETITIQADKKVKYERLSPVVQACSQAGFSIIKFAVLAE
ncbi:MAG: biopolymer transporter ExbD [Bdellovibrionaceae bacterium]|nr:biopolymer transporter ExbD [Pseudobdellovibrionaceae bacterium]